ncbi:TMEM175 family protein [Lacticaseibacillus brantae]|uniref:Integral membrane protein n=1 Tax=Lacticaseibacillus brantae DSM 23927 TaxID=1423727 RepID=A0A0R2B5R1_9LACO|nr:TMEM175 family protein [Lacticaseibacillus brantae]KRM71787.1 integral membrane protein [Lacticaseibacillus brantae DSM 23927]
MKKERLEAFTDGVLAIVLTILVLEIHLPATDHTPRALIEIAPEFLAYVFSFILIATMWVNHHYLFLQVNRINNRVIWANIILLFWSTILPATTAWVGTDIHSQTAAIVYAINIVFYNIAFAFLRESVTRINTIIKPKRGTELLSFGINILTLGVTLFWPPFVFIGLITNVLLWALPHLVTDKD